MLCGGLELRGCSLRATDGVLGEVRDVLFDDQTWAVRYAVVDTRRWLPGRKVLLAPVSLGRPDMERREIPVSLSRQLVRDSPPIESHEPVSRQMEEDLHRWYGWAPLFGGHNYGYPAGYPAGVVPPPDTLPPERAEEQSAHLRSMDAVKGYRTVALDGEVGFVLDFLIEDDDWTVHSVVVDDGGWITGKARVIPVGWVSGIRWAERELSVTARGRQISASPEYDPAIRASREYERR